MTHNNEPTAARRLADSLKDTSSSIVDGAILALSDHCTHLVRNVQAGMILALNEAQVEQIDRLSQRALDLAQRHSRLMAARVGIFNGQAPGDSLTAQHLADDLQVVRDAVAILVEMNRRGTVDDQNVAYSTLVLVLETLKPFCPARTAESMQRAESVLHAVERVAV